MRAIYHHLLSETTCIIAIWQEDAVDRSISEPVLTNKHAQETGPCSGCFKVHDKEQHPYLLVVSLTKSIYYHTEEESVIQVKDQTPAGY